MSKRRRNHNEPRTANDEVEERLHSLREINHAAATGRISWEERVQQSNEVVPGLGTLDPYHERPDGKAR